MADETPLPDKHHLFTQWSQDRGVEIRGVAPAQLPNRGVGLIATKKLPKDHRILFIPEKAMFKPNTTLLKKASLHTASPQAQLAFSAMIAYAPADSSLKVWRETWPTLDDFKHSLPMCWPEVERGDLPPSMQQPLERQLADYQRDWTAVREACAQRGFGEEEFRYYWMIVNSRSFHWKPAGRATVGSMVMCPFVDYLNHAPAGSACRVTMTAKGYEVTADREYAPNEEILITYGSHPNDKLLIHYGFILPTQTNNADDDIRLDHLLLSTFSPSIKSRLQDTGFLGGYALLPATNEVCFKTHVAVRAAMLTCNEWEYFVSGGEDLGRDVSGEVEGFVAGLLGEWRRGRVREMEGRSGGRGVVGERWRQIGVGIDAFVRKVEEGREGG